MFRYSAPDSYEATVGVTSAGYEREWVRWQNCGCHYSRFSRDPDHLDRIYDTDYRDATSTYRKETAESVFKRVVALPPDQSESVQRTNDIQTTIKRLREQNIVASRSGSKQRLLDVGGASGVFAYVFQNEEWTAEIVDPGQQGRFVEAYGITYHTCRFDAEFAQGDFDLISMNYLLEHIADPRAALVTAHSHLAPSGLLYVEVPDELAFKRLPQDDDIFNSCHLWMFDPKSLGALLNETGFEPLKLARTKSPRGHYALSILAARQTEDHVS